MKLKNDLVIFDLEATGTWIDKDKIIEIAMIKVNSKGEETTYDKKINPGIPIPPVVTKLTGISDKDVEEAPAFKDVAQEVLDFIGNADLGGFNVERYDLPLLVRELGELGINFSWEGRSIFDAQKVFHLNEKRDLTGAYQFFCNKKLDDAHSAMADTRATYEILKEQVIRYAKGGDAINELLEFQYKKPIDYYDDERKFRWWNGKLYMMFGKHARKKTLQEIAKSDRGYLEWILSSDFSEEIKNLVSDALQGRFPSYNVKDQGELFNDLSEDD